MRQRQRQFILFFGFFISMIVVCEKENNDNSVGSDNEAFAEDLEKADNLLSSVRQNFEDCQSFGKSYSICIDEVLEYLGGQSDLIDYKMGPDGTTILFTHESGIEGAFLTDVKDDEGVVRAPLRLEEFSRASLPLTFQGYAAIYEARKFPNSTLSEDAKNIFENVGFEVDYYSLDQFSPTELNNIGKYKIILINADGYLNGQNEACFFTGQKTIKPEKDYKNNVIGIGSYDGADSNYLTVCPTYFDYVNVNFTSGSLMFVDSCKSLQTNTAAEKFKDKGLAIYLGWTETVPVKCSDKATIYFFMSLIAEKTVEQIFTQGDREFGDFGKCDYYDVKREKNIEVELRYFPDWQSGFKLDLAEEPVCEPDCEGKECGDDGCGGSCGECYNNTTCTEWGVCILGYSCIEILECMENSECTGTDCYTYMCYDNGTEDAQIKFDIYSGCLENCGLYTEDNLWKYKVCALENCIDEYEDCGGVLQFGSANCVDLGNCFEMCNSSPRSPGELEECVNNCFHNATYQAQLKFSEFFVCTIDECTNLDYNQCVDQMCTDEYSNCVNDI